MEPPSTMAAYAGGTSFGFRTALSHHVLRTKCGGLNMPEQRQDVRDFFFFWGVPPNSDEYLIFLFRFVKVLGRTVDIDNDKSKKKCQQTPTLSRMATAVMAS